MANAHTYAPGRRASTTPGTVTVFVDGLRLDVAHRVADGSLAPGSMSTRATSLAALPTVTQTAKPALVPVAAGLPGRGPDLDPANAATGTKASIQVLRDSDGG